MTDIEKHNLEVPLPSAKRVILSSGITLQPPLSRLSHGSGLIILTPTTSSKNASATDYLSPLQKWAEEGFAVVEIQLAAVGSTGSVEKSLKAALDALTECTSCDGTDVGLIGKSTNIESAWLHADISFVVFGTDLWYSVARFLPAYPRIVAVVGYGETVFEYDSEDGAFPPYLHHLGGDLDEKYQDIKTHTLYRYPQAKHTNFAIPDSETFHYSSESISHSRNLTFLKKHIGGPYFDLEAIWEEHTRYEFAERSVEKTMGTMVQEPYVNHIPTVGRPTATSYTIAENMTDDRRHWTRKIV
jgi:carboxymethylenebutenolidase